MAAFTPIRVRGKRSATEAEKWNAGKRRKAAYRIGSLTPSERSSTTRSVSSHTESLTQRRRKPLDPELSRLEQLPTEVIQAIFVFSANLDLPLTSPRLASQLSSSHLHQLLTSKLLRRIWLPIPMKGAVEGPMRLMNSRFFTWAFFKDWLLEEFDRLVLLDEWQRVAVPESLTSRQTDAQAKWTWLAFRPHQVNDSLLPPKKLLRSPFTPDKVHFLKCITSGFGEDPDELDPVYKELAKEGLEQAVAEGAGDVLPSFWTLGMQPDTELLRTAVIDAGCDKEVVRQLVTPVVRLTSVQVQAELDFLDPALWSWAEKARMKGDEKGLWLVEMLKNAARNSGRKEGEIELAKDVVVE